MIQQSSISKRLVYTVVAGNALLTLDLIIINHFVRRLQSDNHLLELSLRDQVTNTLGEHFSFSYFSRYFNANWCSLLQVLEGPGLRSLLPCLHLVRTVRLNGSQFDDNSVRKLTEVASEVRRGGH